MPGRRRRAKPYIAAGEVLIWILFTALLLPAGVVGWAVGHYTGHHGGSRTVTVTTSAAAAAPATTTTKAAPTTTAAAAKPTANAKAIFLSAGCGACHTFKPAGSTAKIGPDLDATPEKDAKKAKMPLATFVKQSIVDPNAYISPGFPKNIMPPNFAKTLGSAKIAALVNYIVTKK